VAKTLWSRERVGLWPSPLQNAAAEEEEVFVRFVPWALGIGTSSPNPKRDETLVFLHIPSTWATR
jgi:hypothetical protein